MAQDIMALIPKTYKAERKSLKNPKPASFFVYYARVRGSPVHPPFFVSFGSDCS
jgi:hypothetical protein